LFLRSIKYTSKTFHKAKTPSSEEGEAPPKMTETFPWQPWTVIAFDLEGTDLVRPGNMPHITQWSAYELTTKTTFNCYVMPKIPIPQRVRKLTGISVQRNRYGSSQLIAKGEVQPALSIRQAIRNFLDWLDLHEFRKVVLVAHGGERYDFKVLVHAFNNNDEFEALKNRVSGFLDSHPLMKVKFPFEPSYKQVDLVKRHLNDSYSSHDAEEDTKALANLLIKSKLNNNDIVRGMLSPLAVHRTNEISHPGLMRLATKTSLHGNDGSLSHDILRLKSSPMSVAKTLKKDHALQKNMKQHLSSVNETRSVPKI